MDEVCGLFKVEGMPEDFIKKKVFPLSLKGDALAWYRLCVMIQDLRIIND